MRGRSRRRLSRGSIASANQAIVIPPELTVARWPDGRPKYSYNYANATRVSSADSVSCLGSVAEILRDATEKDLLESPI